MNQSRLMDHSKLINLVIAALLCAIGIIIPMFSPVKILLEPASFTLASHVAMFIAMFVSPVVALAVAGGTALGFFWAGFPIVIVMRAATHVVFAFIGAQWLTKHRDALDSVGRMLLFSLVIGVLHAACEVLVVMPFYFGSQMGAGYYAKGFLYSVIGLVGVGTVVHSMVDFGIALVVWKGVKRALPGNHV